MDGGAWGTTVHGATVHKESDTTERLHSLTHSCLNLMSQGNYQALLAFSVLFSQLLSLSLLK